MAQSGVELDDECLDTFSIVKTKKCKAATFIFNKEATKVVVDQSFARDDSKSEEEHWNDLRQYLIDTRSETGCYAVFDCICQKGDAGKNNKLAFIAWAPDRTANAKSRMLISSSKDGVVKKFEGIHKLIQANDEDELSFADMLSKLQK